MSNNNLLPVHNANNLMNAEGEILNPLYMKGAPRSYHLNLSEACLKLEGKKQVTDPEKPFRVIPIAVRVFEGALFGNPNKKWCEFYFVNESGHLGVFMFHSFSLDNFRNKFRELFYEQVSPCDVIWTISYTKKTKNVEGRNNTYYILEFDFEPLKKEGIQIMEAVVANVKSKHFHIYRDDTRNYETLLSNNWSDGKTATVKELAADADREKKLIAHVEGKPTAAKKQATTKKATAKAA